MTLTLSILLPILIVSAIGAALAAIVVISESFLGNYGPCRIRINDQKDLEVQGGKSLLSSLTEGKLFIPSACGGRGTCGLCKLKAMEGAGPVLPTEEPFLSPQEKQSGIRLSCQVKVRRDLKIEIPQQLLSIREFSCTCVEIKNLTHDIRQFRLKLVDPARIDYIPGQYIQLLTPVYEKSDQPVYRAYSISSDPAEKEYIELIIRRVPNGICTTYCFDYLKPGDAVRFNGPYGDFCLSQSDSPILFIAGGSGMAPIKCILHHMKNAGIRRKATYYFGANRVHELYLTDLMKSFESALADFSYVPVVASPKDNEVWKGQTGLVTEAVRQLQRDAFNHEAYLCGSPGMIDACIQVLTSLGMSKVKIFYDKFG